MNDALRNDRRARRISAGMAFCVVATLGVLVTAWNDRGKSTAAVTYDLVDEQVLAKNLTTAPIAGHRALIADEAEEIVRGHLRTLSLTGDSRYLRYAKSTLEAAGLESSAPFSHRMLKARILQTEHEFNAAADLLAQALDGARDHAEAWLLLSDSLQRAGRITEARGACLNVALSGAPLMAQWCGIQILQAAGRTAQAYEASLRLAESIAQLPEASQPWALAIAADAAAETGRTEQALSYLETAMSIRPSTLALRLAAADLLIEAARPGDVAQLLGSDTDNISALVRLALAEQALGEPPRSALVDRVEASFEVAAMTGDELTLRDRAIWDLKIRNDARAALDNALANWQVQKAGEDTALLREAATAARDQRTLDMLDDWLAQAMTGDVS